MLRGLKNKNCIFYKQHPRTKIRENCLNEFKEAKESEVKNFKNIITGTSNILTTSIIDQKNVYVICDIRKNILPSLPIDAVLNKNNIKLNIICL